MAIELYFSNKLELLAEKLAAQLRADPAVAADPLAAPMVIVPNPNLAKWLQFFIARTDGVFLNLDFCYLEQGLWRLLADPDQAPGLLDHPTRRLMVLAALRGLDPQADDDAPLLAYLRGTGGQGLARRLWQLADKLAVLFQEYEYHRSDMIAAWCRDQAPADPLALCQYRVYRRVEQMRAALANDHGRRLETLYTYARKEASKIGLMDAALQRPWVHLFGLSQISPFHLHLIEALQGVCDFHIYSFNPCAEFWEDQPTPGEKRWMRRRREHLAIGPDQWQAGQLDPDCGHPLLGAWGKAGREHVRLLCRLTDYQFQSYVESFGPEDTVLHRLQNDILTFGLGPDSGRLAQDSSVQIAAAPGIFREVEGVYHTIVANLAREAGLELTDIAVLVPDMGLYKPVIEAVFSRRPQALALTIADCRAETESLFGQAVAALFALARGRFSRKEVFDLILNPCLQTRWRIGPEDIEAFMAWAEALAIFHDDPVRAGEGDGGRHGWDQGLKRLRLGRIMGPAPADSDDGHVAELVPYADSAAADKERLETFCALMATMARHRQLLAAQATRPAGQWRSLVLAACDALLDLPPEAHGEAAVRRQLDQALDRLLLYDALDARGLDLDSVAEAVTGHLAGLAGGYGDYLAGGITVSALMPMRPIPFKHIYILGLHEGAFPGRADASSLDLRLAARRIGDVSLPERNRYLFLEAVLAARDKLFLSYVNRDLQKDQTLFPCSVVKQLQRHLQDTVLADGAEFAVQTLPLTPGSLAYLENRPPWAGMLVCHDLTERVAALRAAGLWPDLVKRLGPVRSAALTPPDPDLGAAAPRSLPEGISLGQLRRFLSDPVTASLQRHLNLGPEAPTVAEMALKVDEPFFTGHPADWDLGAAFGQALMARLWADPSDPTVLAGAATLFDRCYERYRRQGITPDGAFALADAKHLKALALDTAAALEQLVPRLAGATRRLAAVIIGTPADARLPADGATLRLPPLALEGRHSDESPWRVTLHGALPWLWQEADGTWNTVVMRADAGIEGFFAPVLFCCAWACAGPSAPPALTVHLVAGDTIKTRCFNHSADQARAYLQALVAACLEPRVPDWMPFDSLRKLGLKADMAVDDASRRAFAAGLRQSLDESDDPLLSALSPPVADDVLDRAIERFSIFLQEERDRHIQLLV